jgi:hypothetical protein
MMSRHLTLFLAGALVAVAAAALAAQSITRGPVDYDMWWKLDVQERIRVFNEVTPENRADLVKEQVTRWLDANRARLNADQIKLLDEVMSAITPDVYRLPRQPEAVERMKALEARAAALLSREDAGDALTIQGPYIPKKK